MHSNAGRSNCSQGRGLLITVQVKQEIGITWNRKFILLCEAGCVSSDQSLLISVLLHLIETHTDARTHNAPVDYGRQVSGEWITFFMPHFN